VNVANLQEGIEFVARRGYRPPIPPACPQKLAQLIRMCLQHAPEDRPKFDFLAAKLSELVEEIPVLDFPYRLSD